MEAEYFSFSEVTCRPPAVGSYLVSVSNNGVNVSQQLLYTVYSSVCQECSQTGVCTFTVSACRVFDAACVCVVVCVGVVAILFGLTFGGGGVGWGSYLFSFSKICTVHVMVHVDLFPPLLFGLTFFYLISFLFLLLF